MMPHCVPWPANLTEKRCQFYLRLGFARGSLGLRNACFLVIDRKRSTNGLLSRVVTPKGLLYVWHVRANGAAIRAIRTANRCGLRTLAIRIDRTRGFLSQVETGKRGASPQTIERIADALGVPVAAITDRSDT
jgi:hypothetical protein